MAYVYQEFPKWKYHPKLGSKIVQNAEEEKALGKGWYNRPNEFPKPSTLSVTLDERVKLGGTNGAGALWRSGPSSASSQRSSPSSAMGNKTSTLVEGTCKLCLLPKQLIRSHLMPAALYDLCRTNDSEPVLVSSKVMMQTSRQLQHPLLCSDCDNLLNQQGETWLIPKLATWAKGFPLYDMLAAIPPDVVDTDFVGYAAARNPQIDAKAITHFAFGIYWKASIHPWRKHNKEPLIELGPYGEQIRKFLRGEGSFPAHMILTVGVVPPNIRFLHIFPPHENNAPTRHNFIFCVPGMQFAITVGKTINRDLYDTCFFGNPLHPVIVRDFSKEMKRLYLTQTSRAHKSRKLIQYLDRLKESSGPPRA